MPMTLKDIEDYDRSNMLRVEHIHLAIVHEVRELKQWDNALTLLTSYLAPVMIASEKAIAAAAAAVSDDANTDSTPSPSSSSSSPTTTTTDRAAAGVGRAAAGVGRASSTTSAKFSDFVEDKTTGRYTKQLGGNDIRLIHFSICALVRYAPTPSDSNVVYMFYLQRQPPVRDDETIDHCLISLIYQYAQVKGDPELQAKGLDLIKVALERGVGLPTYKSRNSGKNQNYRPQTESILVSVSRPILMRQKLQISQDGRTLEAYRPGGQQQHHQQQQGGWQYGQQRQQQRQQQGSQPPHRGSNGLYAGGQRQGQYQGQGQAQAQGQVASGGRSGPPAVAGSSSPLPQPQSRSSQPHPWIPQQTQTQNQTQAQTKTKPRHRKQDSLRVANKDTQDSNNTTATTAATPRQEESIDQYDYYTKASRSFSGTERVKPGSRPAFGGVGSSGGNGGKLREIVFVPASTNPMLKTDHPAPESDREEVEKSEDDITSSLTEHVAKLRLDQASDE